MKSIFEKTKCGIYEFVLDAASQADETLFIDDTEENIFGSRN
jgi:FMN phosphatase YigB (HAD superfamily)